jgi:hypothetical protein
MDVEQLVEWELVGETKAVTGNSYKYHFVHHRSILSDLECKPDYHADANR